MALHTCGWESTPRGCTCVPARLCRLCNTVCSCVLCRYTAHVEGQVRACAQDALQCTVKGSPTLRNAVLVNVAGFLADIPDEGTQVGGCVVNYSLCMAT